MADEIILEKVKRAIGVTGNFMDDTISIYIDEVVTYMLNAGVTDEIISKSAGVVARGVNDLWNNQSGGGRYSPIFYDMVTQRVLKSRGGTDV